MRKIARKAGFQFVIDSGLRRIKRIISKKIKMINQQGDI